MASLFNNALVFGCEEKLCRLYFGYASGVLSRDAQRTVATILLLNTYQKWFLCYHLPRSLKMFFNMLRFLHVKANLRRICEEISLPFFRKMLPSALANYLGKINDYPSFLCGF